ncbi:hypothetical protein E4T43_06354 [Aureobasidium subglaciale]|nr:hypothetical protein E4T43_06354 [Aureobasidium subglaciale]
MLALMPVDNMSLAILPSHTPVTRPTASTRRPKLSLNTASLPSTFGKSTTGLRLDTPSIASPTARNTFSNAYGSQHVTSPEALKPHDHVRQNSRLCLDTSVAPFHQQPSRSSSTDSCMSATSATSATSVSTDSSISSLSTIDSFDKPIPYRLPFNHHSILTNGPHGCLRRRKSFSSTRPMFPSPKKVSFRAPLTEDIHNNVYTLAHSDIESASAPTTSLEPLPSGHGHYVQQQQKHKRAAILPIRTPSCGDKRDSSSEDDSDSDICPSTPITRRSKKPREWVWTLGPINTITPPPSSSPIDDSTQL